MQRNRKMLDSRDRALDSTFDGEHKATPAVLEASFKKFMTILANLANTDGIKIKPFLPKGTLEELSEFGARNTAALGFLMHKVMHDILASSDNFAHDMDAMGTMCNNFRAVKYRLVVFIEVGEITELTETFNSDKTVVVAETSGKTKTTSVFNTFIGYGVRFTTTTTWQLKPVDPNFPTYTFVWTDEAVVLPNMHQTYPITVNVPAATEFDIGALLDLLCSSEQVTATDMGIPENGREFPRRNHRVQAIEAALGEVKQLCDWHLQFLLNYFPNAASQNTKLPIPWSLVAFKRESPPNADDNALGTEVAAALRNHHQEECDHLMHLGPVSELLQLLVLMRTYATHFVACYEGIDHVMVRCFLEGIGAQNARIFKQHESLDNLLMNIGKHQMTRAGIPVKAVGMRSPGCSIRFKVELARSGYFRELEGLSSVDSEHKGQLCFPDSPDDGIATAGTSTRFVVILPVESTMFVEGMEGSSPKIRVEGCSAYDNMPVMLVIGTPEGAKTHVRAAFLFLDMTYMRLALEVSFIPSNKAFVEATAALPKEMADFASAIRAMDVTTSGFCIEMIELRPALAEAIGVKESDLIGDAKWLRQLVHIMRGGASLQSLSQVTPNKRAAPGDATPAYDLNKIRAASQELYDNMIEQGKKDHFSEEPPNAQCRSMTQSSEAPCYKSLAASEAPCYRPLAASEPSEPGNAVPSSDTDTGVDTLLGEFAEGCQTKDVGTNFMKHMLDAMNSLPDPKVAVGIKIGLLDPVEKCLFATGKCPDGVRTVDMRPPAEQDYTARLDLDASTGSLVELLSHCTTPARTQRVVVFGVGCHYESNVLQALMSGERDPTKLYVEIAKKIQAMNA